ncbi:MAG: DUF4156 domain-containing protein [Nitrosomonas sp.]|uniref:DUF4156 domain-containing protein n=1 Tax=Nitrosomonas sp. TaxID=42353 RepID=UPI0025F77C82|nr:DUF4156 domain-containing protein [Nitrosomonas sp.]UJP02052.1 MAG: DUF4156 domain-containing protein [Nitrosomonas sp.]
MSVCKELNPLTQAAMLVSIILSCAGVSAQPEKTKTVTMVVGEHGPDGCELLGKVKGSSKENDSAEDNTLYVDRLIKARNNLRSEAQQLGGNTVHIIYSNNSGRYEIPGADKEIIFVGNVYRCE